MLRGARESVASGNVDTAQEATVVAMSALDRAATKGVMHKNTVARLKSRLARGVRGMAGGQAES